MTLGGLALAVGILVDDATVTIENINRHMEEHGEDILTAITRGAQEIMPPATIALVLHLHRLRAAARARRRRRLSLPAAGDGGRLRDDRLLHSDLHARADDGAFSAAQSASSLGARRRRRSRPPSGLSPAFSRGSRLTSNGSGSGYIGLLAIGARSIASGSPGASSASPCCRSASRRFLARTSSPRSISDAIKIHMRAPTGTRIEAATAPGRSGRAEGPRDHSAGPAREHRRQHRPADQRHQYLLRQYRARSASSMPTFWSP